ncbi:M64 family metallopeptidase [Flavobacteriaceae bacterium SZ-1-7]|uniref:M64 family metallopeptidase n=1 Tax=Tamlana sedimenti TaxID=3134126 RepID=UPI00312A86F3
MKHLLCIAILFLYTTTILAQVFEVESIKVSGDDNNRINLVILSEGYQSSELPQFITDATNFSNDMFTQSPYLEYADYFNVYAIKVPSNESGADHPGTATDVVEPISPIETVDTYFDTSFDSYGFHRLLYTSSFATINNVMADNFPNYDQIIILVNSNVYGGAGGFIATASNGASANEIAIHELGHSLFNLKDEYYQDDIYAMEGINMTQETNPSLVKWTNWMGTNSVGIYQHSDFSGNPKPWYRPHQNCKMRYLGAPFCSVCKEAMVEKIHDLISPIDNYVPNNSTVENPSSFPLDFQLELIKPIPNTLESVWTLNGSNFANNVDDVTLLETSLIEGENILTAVIHDNSPFQRVDNHDNFHVSLVNWKINYTTLGVKDIESKMDNYSISMFPNPASTTVTFMYEGEANSKLNIELVSLDGRMVKALKISNLESCQLDISNLNTGIYITNFYSDKVLIANKKLVKH